EVGPLVAGLLDEVFVAEGRAGRPGAREAGRLEIAGEVGCAVAPADRVEILLEHGARGGGVGRLSGGGGERPRAREREEGRGGERGGWAGERCHETPPGGSPARKSSRSRSNSSGLSIMSQWLAPTITRTGTFGIVLWIAKGFSARYDAIDNLGPP